jgi:hypothetical protein
MDDSAAGPVMSAAASATLRRPMTVWRRRAGVLAAWAWRSWIGQAVPAQAWPVVPVAVALNITRLG